MIDAQLVYGLLQEACKMLEAAGEHATAAHVSYCMALVQAAHNVGNDHLAGSGDD